MTAKEQFIKKYKDWIFDQTIEEFETDLTALMQTGLPSREEAVKSLKKYIINHDVCAEVVIDGKSEECAALMYDWIESHREQPDVDKWQKLADDIRLWSDATFGDGQRNPAIVYHLRKEVDELIECFEVYPEKWDDKLGIEFADCMMLLLDSASHAGISVQQIMDYTRKKLEINKTRKWGKPDENGVIEHIEPEQPEAQQPDQVEPDRDKWFAEERDRIRAIVQKRIAEIETTNWATGIKLHRKKELLYLLNQIS